MIEKHAAKRAAEKSAATLLSSAGTTLLPVSGLPISFLSLSSFLLLQIFAQNRKLLPSGSFHNASVCPAFLKHLKFLLAGLQGEGSFAKTRYFTSMKWCQI